MHLRHSACTDNVLIIEVIAHLLFKDQLKFYFMLLKYVSMIMQCTK